MALATLTAITTHIGGTENQDANSKGMLIRTCNLEQQL